MSAGPILIIANPTSGRGRGRAMIESVAARLRERKAEVDLRYTSARGHAEQLVREAVSASANAWRCVVASGGDGTVQEVVNGLAACSASIPLGLVPSGRCNDFSRVLGIPTEVDPLVEVLLSDCATPVDLGRINGRLFCTVATAGVDAEVTSFVDSMKMPLRGTLAYVYGALRVLMRFRCRPMRLEGDFGVVSRPLLLASTANTSSYGGAIRIAPDADPTDGLLDVCYVDPMSRLRALRLLPLLLAGRHVGRADVHFVRTRRLTLDCEPSMQLWADGERIARTPATIEAVPGAVRVLRPQPATS